MVTGFSDLLTFPKFAIGGRVESCIKRRLMSGSWQNECHKARVLFNRAGNTRSLGTIVDLL